MRLADKYSFLRGDVHSSHTAQLSWRGRGGCLSEKDLSADDSINDAHIDAHTGRKPQGGIVATPLLMSELVGRADVSYLLKSTRSAAGSDRDGATT